LRVRWGVGVREREGVKAELVGRVRRRDRAVEDSFMVSMWWSE
jgi:hypothetical protein